ncbi:hypothetical protein VTK73DRAFT_1619 [Phialemonium thermophilum]|uniref:Uncharacterized protein n=1 Tax=Phialemonium thermophilum TaxID=223376 RepID=A0ABR3X9K4_9PEZI
MSRCHQASRPILRSLQQGSRKWPSSVAPIALQQHFSTTSTRDLEVGSTTDSASQSAQPPPPPPPLPSPSTSGKPKDPDWDQRKLDPNTTTLRWAERRLIKAGTPPIGSRRRRVAIRTSQNIPFEQLPYQCFQEARKILNEDRQEKLAKIVEQNEKIQRLEETDASAFRGGEAFKQRRLESMRRYVEQLKILADINDPLVKRRFEDGLGDMNKPIYRYLADKRWRAMDRKIIMQRISQFFIVPDVLPKLEPTADVKLFFRGQKVKPGEILDSRLTEFPPRLRVQVFDRGERLLSVVVMDSDVPDPASDSFARRCHFIAANIPWDPTKTDLPLGRLADPAAADNSSMGTTVVPWLPPTAQKGAPYHRLGVYVLEHDTPLDVADLRIRYDGPGRDGFSLRSFTDRHGARPVGFTLFRSVWDEGTAEVMARHGIPGADVEFKRPRIRSLKPPRKPRGWEAKRQGPKYRHLWKYTKRIA